MHTCNNEEDHYVVDERIWPGSMFLDIGSNPKNQNTLSLITRNCPNMCRNKPYKNRIGNTTNPVFIINQFVSLIIRTQKNKSLRKCGSITRIGCQTGLPCKSFVLICCRLLGGSA